MKPLADRNQRHYRGYHNASAAPVPHSIEIMRAGLKVDSVRICRPSISDAFLAAIDHARAMVRLGAWAAGQYRFVAVGSRRTQDVELTGPRRA